METDNHIENNNVNPEKPWLWKKGHSGNPKGRPKGKTLKEYVRDYLACMTDEERQDFLQGLPKEVIWKMAEGNPETKSDITSQGEKIVFMPPEVVKKLKDDGGTTSKTEGIH